MEVEEGEREKGRKEGKRKGGGEGIRKESKPEKERKPEMEEEDKKEEGRLTHCSTPNMVRHQ